jgi:hypothetical protein
MTTMTMAVPVLPARDVAISARWYADNLAFEVMHVEDRYAIVERDRVGVHFWGPSGIDPADSDTMYRIRVEGIDELYVECDARGLVLPDQPLESKPWGARQFAILDGDGNLLTFFER